MTSSHTGGVTFRRQLADSCALYTGSAETISRRRGAARVDLRELLLMLHSDRITER